jgi:hypothetical protein
LYSIDVKDSSSKGKKDNRFDPILAGKLIARPIDSCHPLSWRRAVGPKKG